MKKLLYLLIPIMFAACNGGDKKKPTVLVTPVADSTKVIDTTIEEPGIASVVGDESTMKKTKEWKDWKEEKEKKIKISCSFGQQKFNTRKRPISEAPGGVKGKKPKPQYPPVPPPPNPPPPTTDTNVVFIQFFGDSVKNTMWNVSGPLYVGDAGLSQSEFDYIKTHVEAGLLKYNLKVTYDESVFNNTPAGHKCKVIVTEDYQWYGQAGGVAYINSWWWTDGSPAFVFSLLLGYNTHHIAEAIRHEACHTLGLWHQSDCVDGIVTNQYRLGWTMGNSYYVDLGVFGTGTSSKSCAIQDDDAILTAAVGLRLVAMMGLPYLKSEWSAFHESGLRHQTEWAYLKPKNKKL